MRTPILCFLGAALAALISTAHADPDPGARAVRHLPPAEATAGEAVELSARIPGASARTVYLRYRPIGATSWGSRPFERTADDAWVARVDGREVAPPGLEYYLASSTGDGPETDEFASAAAPHQLRVLATAQERRRDRDLARVRQRRSRVHVASEYVSYGAREAGATSVNDHYYRVDADFSYRLLGYPLEEIRFGYTRLEGVVPASSRELPPACANQADADTCRTDAGFKVGGWFELGLGLTEGIRLDGRGMFMANQDGFAIGGRGELRAGIADGNHVALGAEYLAEVGTTGFFRLGWATVPRVVMATTIEVTDLPASVRATGVRLLYDATIPFDNGLRVGARLGYAARDQRASGPTAGLSASFDF